MGSPRGEVSPRGTRSLSVRGSGGRRSNERGPRGRPLPLLLPRRLRPRARPPQQPDRPRSAGERPDRARSAWSRGSTSRRVGCEQAATGARAPRPVDAQGDGRVLPPRRRLRSRTPCGERERIFETLVRRRAARRRGRGPPPLRDGRRAPDRPRPGAAARVRAGARPARRAGRAIGRPRGAARSRMGGRRGRVRRRPGLRRHGTSSTTRPSTASPSRCTTAAGSRNVRSRAARDSKLLVVAAGGGGDGAAVFEMGAQLLAQRPDLVGLFAPGPYAGAEAMRRLSAARVRSSARRQPARTRAGGGSRAPGRSCAWRATTPPSKPSPRGGVRS